MCGVFGAGNKEVLFRQVENEGLGVNRIFYKAFFVTLQEKSSRQSLYPTAKNLKAIFQPMGV